ncbi:hypothetical protein MKX03_028911, partial [Papaver bracteatum]
MSKLDRSGTTSRKIYVSKMILASDKGIFFSFGRFFGLPGSLPVTAIYVPPIDSVGVPSECLILKNMFDPTSETEPDFDLDIKDDVQDEVSKFGTVKHIFLDKNSGGHVYLRFDTKTSAMSAHRALHGRWFAGKIITAAYT